MRADEQQHLLLLAVFLAAVLILAMALAGCATPASYPLAGHPGWRVQESAVPLVGTPDDAAGQPACQARLPNRDPGPPVAPCGMAEAVTDCRSRVVTLWWYAAPGALDHELTHVRACR